MKRLFPVIFLLLLFPDIGLLAQPGAGSSDWKGFERYDFKFKQRDARLVLPEKSLPGNPWIWRARFPDWHTEADSILLSEGFHLAYIHTDNLYGSPRAVKIWDEFYKFLVQEYSLHKKVSLMGVSRGGLFIYNWAHKNPEKVACMYAEAPVCDFKSWPAGFGKSQGSPDDWKKLKKEYGFKSDMEAKAYSNNPLNNLEMLAEKRVPILHMIGLEDKIVPVEENTIPLINKYIALGGIATVVPCTSGEQNLQGHHFPIETPRFVADFIKYHALQHIRLASSDYHQLRGGLKNAHIKFEREKYGRVAFLGGSITYNSGWRDSICIFLQSRFPDTEFEFIAAGIPSMGTTPAAFRLERDVLSKGKIDLLFEEAAVNDAGNERTATEQIRAMEGIVRHCRNTNPEMDMVIMHFVDPAKISSYNKGLEPEVITMHNLVAEHYTIPTINLAKEVADRISHGEFTWETDFKDLHPSPFGQGIYASSMICFLSDAFAGQLDSDDDLKPHMQAEKIDEYAYDNGYLLGIEQAILAKGWQIQASWKPKDGTGTRPNYVNVPMLIAEGPSAPLKLQFEGNVIGIAVAAGQDAGTIAYRIDGNEWSRLNLYTRWSEHLHLPWYYTLSSELSRGKHLLEIRSTDKACRIRYFYANQDK